MNAAQDLETSLRESVNTAMQNGVSPVLIIGLLEVIQGDVEISLRQAVLRAAKAPQLVRSSTLPANGHS